MNHNPFIVGRWVKEEEFYDRRDLIEELMAPRFLSYYLIGNRRMGKTSVLRFLEKSAAENGAEIPLFLDLQGTKKGDAVSMGAQLNREIKRKARRYSRYQNQGLSRSEEDKRNSRKWGKFSRLADFPLEKGGRFCEIVEDLADFAGDKGLRILLLIDEAEKLLHFTTEYLENLRAVLFETPNLRAVVAATKSLGELNNRNWKNSSLLHCFKPKYITPFSEKAAIDLICQAQIVKGGVSVSLEILSDILRHTGGHPYLTQMLCDDLFISGEERLRLMGKKDLVMTDFLTSLFQIDYDGLSPSERRILHQLSERELSEEELISALEISKSKLERFLHSLEQLGFIRLQGNSYSIANTFFLKWLQEEEWKETKEMVSDETTLDIVEKTVAASSSVSDSRNVVSGSEVAAGGDIHIGDINIHQIIQNPQEDLPERLPVEQIMESVRDKVANNQVRSALEELLKYTKSKSPELLNEVISISNQWNRLSRAERMGVMKEGEANIERNKIIKSILEVCGQLEA